MSKMPLQSDHQPLVKEVVWELEKVVGEVRNLSLRFEETQDAIVATVVACMGTVQTCTAIAAIVPLVE